ncbi:PAS domain S-box protein [Parachitinimonas caeni]|uniref:histidine kinase n=1 Tax=Parachitinimonas caeni TaxID=3031301 RepID=A0ABT7DSR0_9NEIS|nr:PAS domain S-box protein [Parachitinimonas caeni]MDK2123111.1 PAS domain S-box protein [Parachitinimonas caeni]
MTQTATTGIHSLRYRLLFASTVVEVVLLALLLFNSMRLIDSVIRTSAENTVAQTVPMLNIAISPYLVQGDYAAVRDNVSEIVGDGKKSIAYVAVFDRNNRLVASAGVDDPLRLPSASNSFDDALANSILHIERPLLLGKQQEGRVRFGLSTSLVAQAKRQLFNQGVAISALSVLLTFVLLSFIAYWVTHRLSLLTEGAKAVADGDYGITLDARGKDEVALLAGNFNRMTAAIRRQVADLGDTTREFRAMFEQAVVGIMHVSPQLKWIRVNNKLLSMLGYDSAEELFKLGPMDIIHPVDRAYGEVARQRLEKGEVTYFSTERRYLKRGGGHVWSLATVTLFRSENGEARYFSIVVQDIGRQKAAALALAESEARYRRLLESTRIVAWSCDEEGNRLLYVGPQIEGLTGVTVGEWQAEGMLRARIYPEDWHQFTAAIKRPQAEFECRLIKRDGSTSWVACYCSQQAESDSRLVQGFFVDIHARKLAEAELLHYREKLEELVEARTAALSVANRELESFSYSVSHDLRAPLRSINGFAQIMLEDYGPRLDAQARDYLDRIQRGAIRMGDLIEALLQLNRFSRGELRNEPVDMSDLAGVLCEELARNAPQRQVEVRIDPHMVTLADKRLLMAALQNLLDNAWKYTAPVEQAKIEFGHFERNGQLIYFVRDNGVGFEPAHASRLFGAFQRLHTSEEFEGYGVGLATVQRIIRRHGGEIWAESQPGQGATFFFTLGNEVDLLKE